MARTTCVVINDTERPLEIAGRSAAGGLPFRGTDWGTTPLAVGHRIAPGERITVGSIGDPGRVETDHWGWLYFDLLRADGTRLKLQLFVRSSSKDKRDASSLGYYDAESRVDDDDDRTQPLGRLGQIELEGKTVVARVTKELAKLESPPPPNGWMKDLPDSRSLAKISMPGTHDTGARHGGPIFECQSLSIAEQLEQGVRYLDVRCSVVDPKSSDPLQIFHDVYPQWLGFEEVLATVSAFLRQHPAETVVMSIKKEKGLPTFETAAQNSMEHMFERYYARHSASFASVTTTPTLGEVRGKIVLVRRFTSAVREDRGIDATEWQDDALSSIVRAKIRVQDLYRVKLHARDDKWNQVAHELADVATSPDLWHLNHLNGSAGVVPKDFARWIRPKLRTHLLSQPLTTRLGTLVLDFPDASLLQRIVMHNRTTVREPVRTP